MKHKTKTEVFIEKAMKTHGDSYSYEKVEYLDSQTKVCIICPKHGEFYQTPAAHVRGCGCPDCANERRGRYERMTPDEFISRAKEVHGDKYDYSKAEYRGSGRKVCIICPEHGEFWQSPLAHIHGKQGCPKCAHRGLGRDELIAEFKKVHGDKYDYSRFEVGKMNEKSCIICPEHGEFWQSPTKHLRGQGCPKCARKNFTTEHFIEKSKRNSWR